MRLSARTRLLEQRLPRLRTVPEPAFCRELLLAETVEHAVSIGCLRHLDDGELGEITNGEWFRRLSEDELVLIADDARQILARARDRGEVAP